MYMYYDEVFLVSWLSFLLSCLHACAIDSTQAFQVSSNSATVLSDGGKKVRMVVLIVLSLLAGSFVKFHVELTRASPEVQMSAPVQV